MAMKMIRIIADWRVAVAPAADALRRGGVLVFPTETVYGIGVAANRRDALAKMRLLKLRPDEKPFQLLAADIGMARGIGAVFSARAERLAEAFWPGALTIVVPDARGVRGGQGGTLGIRVPASELILAICRELGEPIISSSANPAGAPPPANAAAADCFGDEVDLLIDADGAGAIAAKATGTPSTVVRCVGGVCEILREGGVPADAINAVWNSREKGNNA